MTSSTSINIRRARESDAHFLAKGIIMAGRAHVKRGIWEVVLEASEDECQGFLGLLAVTRIPHLYHYSRYMVAEVGRQPAAIAGGYDPVTHGQEVMRQAIPEVMERLGSVMEDAPPSERTMKVLSCIPADLEGAWIIDSLATLPEFRRLGLARMLMEAVIGEGRAGGYRRVQVNMYIGNDRAQALYEKMGFRVHEEKRRPEFEEEIGSPGMLSLRLDLSSGSVMRPPC